MTEMTMPALALLWPSAANYQRFRALCGPDVPESYGAFAHQAARTLRAIEARGYCYRKIDVDPDDMARWCRHHYGRIDATSRSAYAAFVAETFDRQPIGAA